MKLVELLARELEEWPARTVEYVQGKDGCWPLSFSGARFEGSTWILKTGQTTGSGGDVLHIDMASDYKKARVTRAQWQAERDRQKGGEWKRHRGGKCPVPVGTKVSTRHRDGKVADVHFHTSMAGSGPATMNAIWKHTGDGHDIMAYKIISQPQAEDGLELVRGAQDAVISCIAHNDGAGNVTHGPIIMGDEVVGEASPEWRQQAKLDQIETPFKWRDEVTELNAYIEKYTRDRDALIERLASEGFALIPPVVSVVSEFSGVDMNDWRNWKAGDIVVCVEDYNKQFTKGKKYVLSGLDKDERYPRVQIKSDDMGEGNGWGAERFKFHSRP